MTDFELIAREVWDTSGRDDWHGTEIDAFDDVVMQHHTADEFIEPEPEEWYHSGEDPRPPHLGICRTFRAKKPTFGDKIAARRAWNNDHPNDKITKWNEIEHRKRGIPDDAQGRSAWVSVRIDPERRAQLKAKAQAVRAIHLAKLTRIKALERRAMRKMDAYHRRLGWRGIGYNLVQMSRRFYAGRAIVRDGALIKAYRGAHTGAENWNSRSLGVSWNGNFVGRRLPRIMRKATVAFLQYVRCRTYAAHRDVMGTACPGRPDRELQSIADEAGAKRLR